MLVDNQLVEVKWNNNTKAWYESKGYKFTHKFDAFYVYPLDLPEKSAKKVRVICDYCGKEYITSYSVYINGIKQSGKNACSNCAAQQARKMDLKKRESKNFSRIQEICKNNNYELLSSIHECGNVKNYISYNCPYHGIQTVTIDNLLHGRRCSKCNSGYLKASGKSKHSIEEVIAIVEAKNGNKLLNPYDYIDARTKNLKIQCGSCGNIFVTRLNTIVQGKGHCQFCRQKIAIQSAVQTNRLSVNEVEKIINSKNNNILLNKDEYMNVNMRNLKIKCGSCGRIFTTSLTTSKLSATGGCIRCSPNSVGEEIIACFLDKCNIYYTRQEDFDGDCHDKQGLPFDFYLPDYNLCIEFDGIHHYEPIYGERDFKMRKLHDSMKNWYCYWNKILLLRIPYWERNNIEHIIINYLSLTEINSNIHNKKIKYIDKTKCQVA